MTNGDASGLANGLIALAPKLRGDQVERGANVLLDLVNTNSGDKARLALELAKLGPWLKGDQAERGADRILMLLMSHTRIQAMGLNDALVALAPHLNGNRAPWIAPRPP